MPYTVRTLTDARIEVLGTIQYYNIQKRGLGTILNLLAEFIDKLAVEKSEIFLIIFFIKQK